MNDADTWTVEEARIAIAQLGPADMLRLTKAAAYVEYRTGRSAGDLKQEAFVRVLDGRRKCPRNVNVALFLSNVMRSIASETDRDAEHTDVDEPASINAAADETINSYGLSPLEQVRTKVDGGRLLREALALFDDNMEARMMFEGIVEEMEGQELRELLGVSQVEFDTLRRLVRRRLDKHFQGRKP